MKNQRINLLLISVSLLTVLTIWTWIENAYNVDIALTKNIHYQNRWRVEIEESTDTLFLREKALELIDTLNERSIKTNSISGRVQKLLSWTVLACIIPLTLATTELIKRRKNNEKPTSIKY